MNKITRLDPSTQAVETREGHRNSLSPVGIPRRQTPISSEPRALPSSWHLPCPEKAFLRTPSERAGTLSQQGSFVSLLSRIFPPLSQPHSLGHVQSDHLPPPHPPIRQENCIQLEALPWPCGNSITPGKNRLLSGDFTPLLLLAGKGCVLSSQERRNWEKSQRKSHPSFANDKRRPQAENLAEFA